MSKEELKKVGQFIANWETKDVGESVTFKITSYPRDINYSYVKVPNKYYSYNTTLLNYIDFRIGVDNGGQNKKY